MTLRRLTCAALLTVVSVTLSTAETFAAEIRATIYFQQNTVQLTPTARETIGEIAKIIVRDNIKTVTLVGHCDTADEAPTVSSRYRAKGVADELRAKGVPPNVVINWHGVGATDLAVATPPNVHEPLNRRVTVAY